MRKPFWLKRICLLAMVLAVPAGMARADNRVESFTLYPPKISVKPICAVKEPIDALRKRWSNFSAAAVKKTKLELLRANVQRLISYDANANFEIAEKLLRHLMKGKDRIRSAQYGADLVKLHIEANRLDTKNAKELLPLLETGPLAGSANNLYLTGLIYEQGQAVSRDAGIAYSRFFASAQAGNPDALLKLIKLKQAGLPQAQSVDLGLTMTMAINAMLADRSPAICARIKNITRLFSKGEYIAQDHQAAAAWLQLAADFGDAEAAWKVARMHLRSELIVKDNAVLVKYMGLAAEGGVVPAMIELATIYLDGSLADADPEKAEHWYVRAGEAGSIPALLRLVELHERQGGAGAEKKIETILRRVAARPEAPAHALVALAKIEMKNGGHLAGLAAARPLLERAAKLGDPEAQLAVARMDITSIIDRRSFRAVANSMETAAATGNSDAMLALSDLHMCHNSSGTDFAAAKSWRDRALGAGNKQVELEQLIASGPVDPDSLSQIALLRSNALSGSADALAYLMDTYDKQTESVGGGEEAGFWQSRLAADASATWRYAKLSMSRGDQSRSHKFLEDAAAAGNDTAKIDLAKLLISGTEDARTNENIDKLLMETAQQGRGESLELLLRRKGQEWLRQELIKGGLQKSIVERGDYRAFIFAAGLAARADRKALLAKAAILADCSFDGALRMARAFSEPDENGAALAWANIAAALEGPGGDGAFRLAEFYQQFDAKSFAGQIDTLLNRAAEQGHSGAVLRLLSASTDPNSPGFDRKKAMKLAENLRGSMDPKALYKAARALSASQGDDAGLSSDALELLQRASALGHVPAMRDYGMVLLRDRKSSRIAMATAIDLLTRAADQGDARAMVELARSFAMGIGVEASRQKAEQLLQDARALGNEEAADLLLSLAKT